MSSAEKDYLPSIDFLAIEQANLPLRALLECRVTPISCNERSLSIIADNDSDVQGAFAVLAETGYAVHLHRVPSPSLERAITRLREQDLAKQAGTITSHSLKEPAEDYQTTYSSPYYVDMLVSQAISSNASDIHIQPGPDHSRIRLRIDGKLRDIEQISKEQSTTLVTQIKILARLPVEQKRLPHDGRFSIKVNGNPVDMRVSVLPSIHGEALVMRLEEKYAPQKPDELGMPPPIRERVESFLRGGNGMLLMGGPTGCGKTTTMYAMLRAMSTAGKKLISVEDPVERIIEGVNQLQVHSQGMGFDDAIRAMLRHSPDMILVGEIRDQQTAAAATEAALTGHAVIASIHARDAAETVPRMRDLGVPAQLISCVLELALSQRLLRKLCPHCASPATTGANLLRALGIECEAGSYHPGTSPTLRGPAGCPRCAGTGFSSRTAIFELIDMQIDEIRTAVQKGAGAKRIREIASSQNIPNLANAARSLVLSGTTSPEEAIGTIMNSSSNVVTT